jgi:hypothetical protein
MKNMDDIHEQAKKARIPKQYKKNIFLLLQKVAGQIP